MLESPLLLIIGITFLTGFVAQRCDLPPLVGFLLAGFSLRFLGLNSFDYLEQMAEVGVYTLLFTIGLKLNPTQLLQREVLLGATAHTLLSAFFITIILALLGCLNIPLLHNLVHNQWWLLAFALSFSSTVLAVKALQEKGELSSTYGRLSLGILVIQDLVAVLFLTFSTGKVPTNFAWLLLLLPLCRPLLHKLLTMLGHDEILVLGGITLALLPGAALFNLCGLNPDLGALVVGMLLATHPRASELSTSLFSLKELLLIGFFINIGLTGTPTWQSFGIALLLTLALPLKGILYYAVVRVFKFRIRTGLQTAVTLCNFSEFGLIVGNIAVKQGLLDNQWLVVLALATAISFLIAAPLNQLIDRIYLILSRHGVPDNNDSLHPDDKLFEPGYAKVLILGMGRIGSCAYDELRHRYGDIILGVEPNAKNIQRHHLLGRNVIVADPTDPDFWQCITNKPNIRLILLTITHWRGTQAALQQLRNHSYKGRVAAIVQYEDEMINLQTLGVDATFNIYDEAGCGFARHVISILNSDRLLDISCCQSK